MAITVDLLSRTEAGAKITSTQYDNTIAAIEAAFADAVDDDTQIIAGDGLDGGGALTGNVTLEIPVQGGLSAGAYPAADVTVDARGIITAISAGSGAGLPVADTQTLVKGSADATKLMRFEVDGLTAGATRVITMADQNVDLTPTTGTYLSSADDTVTNAKLADMAQSTLKGRAAGAGTGDPTDLTAAQAKTLLAITNSDVSGLGALALLSTVGTTQIDAGAVTTVKLGADAVDGTKIADDSLDSEHYATASIDTEHLNDRSVTEPKLSLTGVSAGSYTAMNATVDATGRITAASSGLSSSGLTLVDDANTSISLGDSLAGTNRRLTSDSAITATLQKETTKGTRIGLSKAGSGTVTVAVEAGSGYRMSGQDASDAASTTSFTVTGYAEVWCDVDGASNTAEWRVLGETDIATTLDADLNCNNNDLLNIGAGSTFQTPSATRAALAIPEVLILACSDETTAITTGTAKVTFRMPFAMTLTAVRASVTTAPTGSTIIIDINETGTTVLSTKLSIDATEKTSTTAASAAVISDSALADDAEITIDFDQVGATIAGAGVKVYLIGTRA